MLFRSVEGATVQARLSADHRVGTVLASLGPLTASIRHVREIPMPLRDLIAQVYKRGEGR